MKLIDKIGYKLLLIIIVLLNIFIGSNIKPPIWLIQTIVSVFTVIYMIIKKIQKEKNVILKGKIDIFLLGFMVSTIIPCICKNYVSLDGTINFILKYWSVYCFYILTRNIVIDKEKINGIEITLIISSIIPIIIGYDKLSNKNILNPILDKINSVKIEDNRMISIFGYANTFAAYLGLTTSLAIGQLKKSKKVKKILYCAYIVVASITILLTQSKFVIALIALIILLFIINEIKNKKIPLKWVIVGSSGIIIFLIYVFIAKDIGKPLVVIQQEKDCVLRGFEKNTNYEFQFDVKAESSNDENAFEIYIVEITRYFSEKTLAKMELGSFEGIKTVNIDTTGNIDHIEIRIKNKFNQKITINELRINGSPYILEYKIILEPIVRIFTTFNFKNSSVWQRGDYWKDCLKIIKQKGILGGGGNTWRYSYGQVQEYLYYAKECHSYILEIIMSFGLIGITSYICIIIKSIKSAIEVKKDMLPILIGVSIILIHSLMDFDMSYLIIEMIVFMFIAIININDKLKKEHVKCIKITEYIVITFITIVSIGNMLGLISQNINDDTSNKKSQIAPWVLDYRYDKIMYMHKAGVRNDKLAEEIKRFIKDEPFYSQKIMYGIICECDLKEDDIEFLIDTWKNIPIERPYDIINVRKRSDIMLALAKKVSNMELRNEILGIIKLEYPMYARMMLDNVKNQETNLISRYEFQYYTSDYKEAIELLEK